MTLKEIFKKYNAQPGFKFKKVRAFLVYEVLCIGIESVFVKNISDFGEESSFDLDMEGYVKYKEPKKTKKIMVADYYNYLIGQVYTLARVPDPDYVKVIGSDRQIEIECDE